ncbi:gas vesicle protein GvpO [Nocardia sp. CA-135953]|uniref:gas vesicle protein GvpO n=1 Tax=Nocardia sp. CA-135953 TaxID=3239978 RepID=UPI003D9791C4
MTTPEDPENVDSVSDEPPPISAAQASAAAIDILGELTSKHVEGVTSMETTDDGWVIEMEVLEDRRIPSSSDMLALYELELDVDGNLLAYRRTRRYYRGSTDIGGRNQR